MFSCFKCGEQETFPDAEAFIAHILCLHSELQVSGTFKCTFRGCPAQRQFDKINSFKKHVRSHKPYSSVLSNVPATLNCVSDIHENYANESDLDSQNTCVPENLRTASSNDGKSVFTPNFDEVVTNSVVAFIATMYDIGLTESQIQVMVESHIQLVKGPLLTILQNYVLDIIQNDKFNVPAKDTKIISRMFDSITNMFNGFETTYKRNKEFESCGSFIPPESFVIGQALMETYVDGNVVMEPTTLNGQFIPMCKVLKGFLELPGVLGTILQHMENLESDTSGRISNIIQGTLWREKIKPKFQGKIVVPVVFKFDDYEPGKSLGSHAVVYNLGAGYVRLPTLPPQFQGALENIFLSTLFHTCDKFFGNVKLFRKVIGELKYLEENGIFVVTPEETFHVFFALCIAGGDNKGANEILGFASFSSNFYCRICSIHRKVAAKAVCSDPTLIRTPDSYEKELKIDNFSLTGRKDACVFNELNSFHVAENFHLDLMHDLDEGCWKYLLSDIIKYFLQKGRFSVNYLNECIQGFNYGPNEERNRPPIIDPEHFKKNDSILRGSASETRCLIRYLGLMIGHLVLKTDYQVWNIYLKARSIVDIVTAPSFHNSDLPLLKCLIREHHSEYLKVFKTDLKPKFHLCTHIPEVMALIGPLEPLTCLRIESKHKEGVQVARKSNNRINLPKTVATRHQQNFSFRLLSGRGLIPDFQCSRVQLLPLTCLPDQFMFVNIIPPELHDKILTVVKWVKTNGMKYEESSVVLLSVENQVPLFAAIHSILLFENNDVSFIVKCFNTDKFDSHVHAYEVSSTNLWKFVNLNKLHSYVATEKRTAGNRKQYVAFRYSVNNC